MLQEMDRLERIAEPDGYRRQEIWIIDSECLFEMSALVYLKPLEQLDLGKVKLGPLASYELQHARFYRKRIA